MEDLSYIDPSSPTLRQSLADILRGMTKKEDYQQMGQAIQNTGKLIPSITESLARGAIAQVPGTFGDISQLAREYAPNTMQSTFGNRVAPTTEEILQAVPRINPDYQGSSQHEMVGSLTAPALAKMLKMGAEATKGLKGGLSIAYHGTPHEIQGGFDMAKIGTGEGAQAYGHGIYFAENPSVANAYKTNLVKEPTFTEVKTGKVIAKDSPEYADVVERQARMERNGYGADFDKKYKVNEGNLYKVDVPDEHIATMMNWDEPFSKQPKLVQDAFLNILKHNPDLPLEFLIKGDATGGSLIQAMDKKKATDLLLQQNVKGIKYLDEGSRGNYQAQTTYKGKPYSDVMRFYSKKQLDDAIKEYEKEGFGVNVFPQTHNFVSFEPQAVKILEKNNKPTRKELLEKQLDELK